MTWLSSRHVATLKSSISFVHFFDGFRTSHEEDPDAAICAVEEACPTWHHGAALGTLFEPHASHNSWHQPADIIFQNLESAKQYNTNLAEVVQQNYG